MGRELAFGPFIAQVQQLCAEWLEATFDHEAHASALAELCAQLDLEDPSLTSRFEWLERGQTEDYLTQRVSKTLAGGVMLVSLRAGAEVGLHDHPQQSGFILCCGGEVRVDSFDPLPTPPLRLRHGSSRVLETGDWASLTPDQNNIHQLRSSTATRLIDIFTPPLRETLRSSCLCFELGEETEPGIFTAHSTPAFPGI